ncbi:hypothetical protein FOL47_009434 [Perkinsus chesapeaki]|uniref:Uncharacterized protein n=1 Tax=Perkinsus chesapeaki TaxID=330153 RepID=A0A7J6L886_PERCH|nr:hypothetical protein FOL47_009434 [Perkinsus chesapeaki]
MPGLGARLQGFKVQIEAAFPPDHRCEPHLATHLTDQLQWLAKRADPALIIAKRVATLVSLTEDGGFDARGILLEMQEPMSDPEYRKLEGLDYPPVIEPKMAEKPRRWNLARRLAIEAATSQAVWEKLRTKLTICF